MILVELWGETFFQLMATAEPGRTVLQVDNGRVVVAKDPKIHITAEYFKDSDMGSSWACLDPEHSRGVSLRQLSNTKGERILCIHHVSLCIENTLCCTCLNGMLERYWQL